MSESVLFAARVMRATIRRRVLLVLGSLVASALLAEGALRLFFPVAYMAPAARFGDEAWLEGINRRSTIDGLDYELRPGVRSQAHGVRVETNAHGMRDRERTIEKPPGVVRVAAVGDSFTFGFGVPAEDAWPAVLERLLNEARESGARPAEVLNFGVGGYSTRDEALVVRERVLAFQPDAIVLGYVCNDPETDPIQPLHAFYHEPDWWQGWHLLRLAAQAKNTADIRRHGGGDYVAYLHRGPKWQTVLDGFDAIAAATRARAVPVVVALFPMAGDLREQVERAARDRGFLVVRVPGETDPSIPAELPDGHPNAYGHRRTAETLRDALLAERVLR